MKRFFYIILFLEMLLFISSCEEQKEHTAPAIYEKDSASVMTTYGVNTLISDSGVIKYRIVTERWDVNQARDPQRWTFEKGLFMEQFDEKFHVQAYVQCDTAYYYNTKHLWELRSRVRVLTKDGLRFSSEQLFWDERKHEFYSHVFSHLVTPERTLQGSYFRSNEDMTRYYVSNSKGSFVKDDIENEEDTTKTNNNMNLTNQRQQAKPQRKSSE